MLNDLHIHSQYSIDGRGKLKNVLEILPHSYFSHIAITEHNTIAHYKELSDAILENPSFHKRIILGCEFSCHSTLTLDIEFHILGYWNLLKNNKLLNLTYETLEEINKTNKEQFDILIQGFENKNEILQFWKKYKNHYLNENVIDHPFILNLYNATLKNCDYEIFRSKRRSLKQKLSQDNNWPQFPSPRTIIEIIKTSKGISILAHPEKYPISSKSLELTIKNFKEIGLCGIEVKNSRIKQYQDGFQLIATTGSDLHNVDIFNSSEHIEKLYYQVDLSNFFKRLKIIA